MCAMFIFPQKEVGLHLAGMLHGLGYVLHWIVRVRGSSQGAEIKTENQAIAECCGARIGGRMIFERCEKERVMGFRTRTKLGCYGV